MNPIKYLALLQVILSVLPEAFQAEQALTNTALTDAEKKAQVLPILTDALPKLLGAFGASAVVLEAVNPTVLGVLFDVAFTAENVVKQIEAKTAHPEA